MVVCDIMAIQYIAIFNYNYQRAQLKISLSLILLAVVSDILYVCPVHALEVPSDVQREMLIDFETETTKVAMVFFCLIKSTSM